MSDSFTEQIQRVILGISADAKLYLTGVFSVILRCPFIWYVLLVQSRWFAILLISQSGTQVLLPQP